jgi:hypothetical protein
LVPAAVADGCVWSCGEISKRVAEVATTYCFGSAEIRQCGGQVECRVPARGSDRPTELNIQPLRLGKRVADRDATEPTDDFSPSRTLSQILRQRPTEPPDLPSPAEILANSGALDGPPDGP